MKTGRNYPLCRICGKSVGWYDRKAHLKCIKGKNHHLANKNNKPFVQLGLNREIITVWQSISEIERIVMKRRSHVLDVLKGKRKTAYGFIWNYV
jgi:hypothetical protein